MKLRQHLSPRLFAMEASIPFTGFIITPRKRVYITGGIEIPQGVYRDI